MIVTLGKNLHTFTRNEHTEQLSLGRRLQSEQLGLGRRHPYIIVGIIGIPRVFQMFTVVLQTFSYLQFIYVFNTYNSSTYKFLHTNSYIQILTYKLRH